MRYAIISDVHANLEALNAVLENIREETVDGLLFLGDSVGYGPNPNECIETLKKKAKVLLAGNHDWAILGITNIEYFNPYARAAIAWTANTLSDENKLFLRSLSITETLEDDNIYLAHSSPREPELWHYLLSTQDAYVNFHFFSGRICLIGHCHKPDIIELSPVGIDSRKRVASTYRKGNIIVYKNHADIKDGHRYIINVGSVGQPRDGNPDAAYALLNKNSIEIKRVSYDIVLTQKKMRDVGLPPALINRLSRGV